MFNLPLPKKIKSLLIVEVIWGNIARLSRCAWKAARSSHRKECLVCCLQIPFLSWLVANKNEFFPLKKT